MRIIDTKTWIKATGRIRLRLGWLGKLILQVEHIGFDDRGDRTLQWFDAKITDLDITEVKL